MGNDSLKGLRDKFYWRPSPNGFCCFEKDPFARKGEPRYASLCGQYTRTRSGGQRCSRPPAVLRCVQCDLEEMKLRGVEESMPCTDESWRDWRDWT